jgi:hypothetical protein
MAIEMEVSYFENFNMKAGGWIRAKVDKLM